MLHSRKLFFLKALPRARYNIQTSPVNCTKALRLDKVKPPRVKCFSVVLCLARLGCLKFVYSWLSWLHVPTLPATRLHNLANTLPLQTGTRKDFITLCPPNRTLLVRQQGNLKAAGQPYQCTWVCTEVEDRASFPPLAYCKYGL